MHSEELRPITPVAIHNLHDHSGRVPPQAIDVEEYILSAMLLDPNAVTIATAILPTDAFYLQKHQAIYSALLDLSEKSQPTDIITAAQRLRSTNQLDMVGGLPYLNHLSQLSPTSVNTEFYARIIVEKALLRQAISSMTKRITEAYDPGTDAFELLDGTEKDLFEISHSQVRKTAQALRDILQDTINHIQEIAQHDGQISGITTGFTDLDSLTGGWQDSDLIIIAGRPSMGKCVDTDTPILQADGQLVRIADLYDRQNANLLTLGEDSQFSVTQPSAYIYDGIKPVYRVTTQLGRTVSTTLSHPFLTYQGWQPLGDLTIGNCIAVPRELPVHGIHTVSDSAITQLVHTLRDLHQIQWSLPDSKATAIKLKGVQALPPWVFTLNSHNLSDLVGQLFGNSFCNVVVSSRLLAQQLSHLCLRVGMVCKISKRLNGWSVNPMREISQGENHIIFDEIVRIEALGDRPVYDLTIDETHNFVASDVCVHNTAFALACARNAAMNPTKPVPCAIFSLEMSSRQLAQRLITSEARVNGQAVRSGNLSQDNFNALVAAASRFHNAPIYIDDSAGLGVLELRAKCRRLKSERNIGLVLVDYLQLMQGRSSNDNREQEIANISRSLKELAKELDIPVVALSQLNRNAEDRKDRRPQLADLRESGAIEQDADVVAFIYRAEYYGIKEETRNGITLETEGMSEIIIGKHRNGPTGSVDLKFLKQYARFENYEKYHRTLPDQEPEEDPF